MKPYVISLVVGGLAFVFLSYQLEWIASPTTDEDEEGVLTEVKKQEQPKTERKTRFPADLAPAARAIPVPDAGLFTPGVKQFPMVFLKTNGSLYEPWQDRLNEGWAAESVEQTQLAIVLGPHRKIFVDHTDYPGGAPPIERYRWELEASVIEARTGKILANRNFVNIPRALKKVESWELTEIGQPVAFKTVYNWVVSNARANFPELVSNHPVVTVVE